ncbi:MAG: hypothetical protein ACAI25_16805 [Planctomycetota bacterium]
MLRFTLLVAVLLVAGCSSSETKPSSGGTSTHGEDKPAPATHDVTLTVKNDAKDPRNTWIETYEPGKGDLSGAPIDMLKLGTLAAGESITKTFPLPHRGWYRVVAARELDESNAKVIFIGKFTRAKEQGAEAPVSVNR